MTIHRMSRNTEARNARQTIVARGRASLSREALLEPDQTLTGRRFRRANKLSRAEAHALDVFVRRSDGRAVRPTSLVQLDDDASVIAGWQMI